MIAVEARLFTYVEAAERCNRQGSDSAKHKFMQRRVASGDIVVTDLGYKTKRISELDLQNFIQRTRAVERARPTKRKRK